ncbi:hypothetical protein QYE76_036293 [Lolium multiflorum]|uniref:Integrase catalytic domain-containing protein n=1 Tax=Lolium multiflorum TaxID=4521 RepID=A0AAD8VPU3_LOLMU|nr:hypothetical protein QYE76_036293 [Lolium multiflorum]
MGLDDLLSKQRSNHQKFGLGYVPKSHKKKNYNKEKPAQDKNKKVTNNGKASKGKATSGDRTGPNDHYALFVDYYGDVYANYVGPPNGYAYREYSIWGYSSGGPKWVFDSGCTNHMTGGKGVLDQFIEDINKKSSITFGDNSKGKVLGYGKVAISKDLCLETVMLVEHLGYNLLSIYHLADAGYNSYFTKYYVQVFRSDNLKLVLVGYVENNLYVVDLSKESPSFSTCLMAAKHDEGWLWHRRLGHVNMRNLKQLLKGEHIVGLTGVSFEKDRVCSACVAGKQLKKKHPIKSIVTTSRPLELLHLDLFGPSHYDTLGGSKYGLVIVDDYSRYSWVFLLKSKDETYREFITFAKKAQRMYESEIKAIRTDNGTEFKNYTMQEFVDDEGIKHEFSAPYTPQQNGVVERKNRTIIEMARTMLSEFNSPHNFWGEAISTAVHYSNRLFLRPLHNKTPYELLTGNKPNVMYIRVFGCKCLVKNNKGKLGKFETRTIEGIFVGYAENSHAYRYYNRSSGTIEVSCDVVFLEDNGSQVEQVVPCVAGNDDDPSSAIKHMGIGHIRPMEVHNDDQDDGVDVSSTPQVEPSSTQAEPSSATQEPSSTQDESQSEEQEEDPHSMEQDHDDDQETSSTHDQAQVVPHDQVLARDEFIDHEGTVRKIKAATRASDMKVDQVLGRIKVDAHAEFQLGPSPPLPFPATLEHPLTPQDQSIHLPALPSTTLTRTQPCRPSCHPPCHHHLPSSQLCHTMSWRFPTPNPLYTPSPDRPHQPAQATRAQTRPRHRHARTPLVASPCAVASRLPSHSPCTRRLATVPSTSQTTPSGRRPAVDDAIVHNLPPPYCHDARKRTTRPLHLWPRHEAGQHHHDVAYTTSPSLAPSLPWNDDLLRTLDRPSPL